MMNTAKEQVARAAAAEVRSGMWLGLGSGSTVYLIIAALGERLRQGDLADIQVVVASNWSEAKAREAGLPLTTLVEQPWLDLAIDGADEVDPSRNMIKGGGGAMLRERIVLGAAEHKLIAVDEAKLVTRLGERWAVPVEVVQFGLGVAERILRDYGAEPHLRMDGDGPFRTDEGNIVFDCHIGPIADPLALSQAIYAIPGVVAHGLFLGYADQVLVGSVDSVHEL
jgi:ribose 5-phosphate isomerase A